MLCAYPRHQVGDKCRNTKYNRGYACGQCMPCRVNRRRQKTSRMILESKSHDATSFVTLTYAKTPASGSLKPEDFTLWLKRFREKIGPFRYFGVGEYGKETERPHYHAIIFGHDAVRAEWAAKATWNDGFIMASEGNYDRFAYTAQYCVKKMTSEDHRDLQGRHPEFTRQSLKPGIGAVAADEIANWYHTKVGANYLATYGDISQSFRYHGKIWPFDAYLLKRMRTELGVPLTYEERQNLAEFTSQAGPSLEFETDKGQLVEDELRYRSELDEARRVNDKLWARSKCHGTL